MMIYSIELFIHAYLIKVELQDGLYLIPRCLIRRFECCRNCGMQYDPLKQMSHCFKSSDQITIDVKDMLQQL
jgi:hypothetical protein